MDINADDIRALAEVVWEATLGMALTPGAGAAAGRARSLVASVQITGAWNGAVLLDCPADIARRAGAAMFSVTPEQVGAQDMQDAVAELVNIIGGNLKGLLPETCYLSLPSVIEGADYSTRMPGARALHTLSLLCEGLPVTITVVERNGDTAARAA